MQTIVGDDGRPIFFSFEDFKALFFDADRCFLCGDGRRTKAFNKEHVIPQWIQRIYDLASKTITLPNGSRVKYGRYTLPCCVECNSRLSSTYENPLSAILKRSSAELNEAVVIDEQLRGSIYIWLSLLFFKSAISKRQFHESPAHPVPGRSMATDLWLHRLHHVHCIARAHLTNAIIETEVFGSVNFGPCKDMHTFDYCDNLSAGTIMITLGDKFVIAAMWDACAANSILLRPGGPLTIELGPCSVVQIRELYSHMTHICLNLKEEPEFHSRYQRTTEQYVIGCTHPDQVELVPPEHQISLGQVMAENLRPFFLDRPLVLDEIRNENHTFLVDADGAFLNHGKVPPELEA